MECYSKWWSHCNSGKLFGDEKSLQSTSNDFPHNSLDTIIKSSDIFICNTGVSQGEYLSTLLFLPSINDKYTKKKRVTVI